MKRSTTCGFGGSLRGHPTSANGKPRQPSRSRRRDKRSAGVSDSMGHSERTGAIVECAHVYRPRTVRAISLQARTDDQRSTIPADGKRAAELAPPFGIVALPIGALGPPIAGAAEQPCGTGFIGHPRPLVAIDSLRAVVLE